MSAAPHMLVPRCPPEAEGKGEVWQGQAGGSGGVRGSQELIGEVRRSQEAGLDLQSTKSKIKLL